ncbi:hypothetical protein L195_g058646, partial [Trifolium pratense]
ANKAAANKGGGGSLSQQQQQQQQNQRRRRRSSKSTSVAPDIIDFEERLKAVRRYLPTLSNCSVTVTLFLHYY